MSNSIRDLLLNWNKFGSGSRNLGDLLYLLFGREYLNRTNRPVDIFASEQNN